MKSPKSDIISSSMPVAGSSPSCWEVVHAIGFRYVDNQILTKSTHLKARQDVIDDKGQHLEDWGDALDMTSYESIMKWDGYYTQEVLVRVSCYIWLSRFSDGWSSKDAIESYRFSILLKKVLHPMRGRRCHSMKSR